ncbi:hypothetical protein DHEL01_v202694 [Diaporthe helianthi]|uniref:Short-chain dehydrogenase n=1 Tax=Diaporthe helianthi TaxID=158607 RepID=A0A2P5I8S2_DIAHE|nr:hypothetical protein DHEL01_v202694 [Diaporthe helianthi]
MPFPHKTVLITGATAGIGRALAERMVENGVFVIAVGRRRERLQELEAKYGRDKVVAEEFDMTKTAEIQAWAQRITKDHPTLSSIILNAGIQRTLDFTNPSYDEFSSKITSEIDLNYTSPLLTITAFLPHLISLGGGGSSPTPASVILVTSGLAIVPMARCANYCSTKSALHHFGLSLRSQLQSSPKTQHIRVIIPAYTLIATQTPPPDPSNRSGAPDFTAIILTLLRLEKELTDILITVNVPHIKGEYDDEEVDLQLGKQGKLIGAAVEDAARIWETFRVNDWNLFNEI